MFTDLMPEIDSIQPGSNDPWKMGCETLSKARKSIVEDVRKWAITQEKLLILRELCRDQPEVPGIGGPSLSTDRLEIAGHPKKHFSELERAVVDEFGRGEEAREALIIIARVMAADNRIHSVQLPIPQIPRKWVRERNPFQDGTGVQAIRAMRELKKLLETWIASCKTPRSSEEANGHRQARVGEPQEHDIKGGKEPENKHQRSVSLGLVALSAIIEGGLLHRDIVEALLQLLQRPDISGCPIEWWGKTPPRDGSLPEGQFSRPFIDLSLRWRSTQDAELRRWFPDPQTACLIVRLYQDREKAVDPDEDAEQNSGTGLGLARGFKFGRNSAGPEGRDPKKDDTESTSPGVQPPNQKEPPTLNKRVVLLQAWDEIKSELKGAKALEELELKSLNDVIHAVRLARFADNYPSLIVGYCSRRLVSHSLRHSVLPRFLGRKILSPITQKISADAADAARRLHAIRRSDEVNESPWYSDLLNAQKGATREKRKLALDALVTCNNNYPPAARLIMEFASYKLNKGSVAGNRLAPSTVRAYSSYVARFLGGLLAGLNPTDLTDGELITLYGEAIDAADQGRSVRAMRRVVARSLHEFHDFLVKVHGVPEVDRFSVFGIGQDLVPVDANLLTPDEYAEARRAIENSRESSEIRDIALILMSLGYWLGLRRNEGRGLHTVDVSELGIPMLLIRPWGNRTLKTPNSVRVLPLNLVPDEERARLFAWKTDRQSEQDYGTQQLLFNISDGDMLTVFELIHVAMAKVTGDPRMRYHHLRHSCASWSFLRLCISDFRRVPNLFPTPALQKTREMLLGSSRFREYIYSAIPAVGPENHHDNSTRSKQRYAIAGPIRQHAFALARLLGHADPSTTLEHYVHFLDLVVPLYRATSEFFPLHRRSAICAGDFFTSHHDVDDLPAEIWRKLPGKYQRRSPDSLVSDEIEQYSAEGRWIERTWRMLYASATAQLTSDDLAAQYGFAKDAVDEMLKRAVVLRNMKISEGSKYRHSMTEWSREEYRPDSFVRLACPKRPDTEQDKAKIREHEAHLAAAIAGDMGRARRVLDYFVTRQQDDGPLYFDSPDHSGDAEDYLAFLDALKIRRLNVLERDTNRILKPSEIRFIALGKQSRGRWQQAVGKKKTRDDAWIELYPHDRSMQKLGILVHWRMVAKNRLFVSEAFCFVMLMAWIACPFLLEQTQ
jgi:integrase